MQVPYDWLEFKGQLFERIDQTNITKSSSGKQHCTTGKKRKEE